MSNVLIDKQKIDILANAISDKSGVPVTMTLDEMVEAVDSIEIGGGGITPTGNINITQAGVTDVTDYATATVQQGDVNVGTTTGFYTQNNVRKWHFKPFANIETGDYAGTVGFLEDNYYKSGYDQIFNAIASGTSVTPTESAQTIGGVNYMMAGAVTVNAIPSNYVGSGITRRSSSDLIIGGREVTAPSGYYANGVTGAIPYGTEGSPTATKGTVSNHSVSVTPRVINTEGYIEGGTLGGTAVTVSASELVSGTYTVSASGTHDVTNYASASVTSGSATASATKGTVSNHSVTVTPSVTRTAGYITAGSANGTAVTVSASELVSGSETKTANGTYDVTNLASLVVNIPFVTYYTGSSDPSSSLGSNGDIYLKVVS